MNYYGLVALGFVVGILSGMIGLGGAVFIVPALVYFFGWEQHMAQGTTLAMLVPPIGILAAWKYYEAGHVNLPVAGILCAGFFIGSYIGGTFANQIPGETLRRVFGFALLIISIKMIIGK